MSDWELEEGKEHFGYGLKGSMGVTRLVYVPFCSGTHLLMHKSATQVLPAKKLQCTIIYIIDNNI
jgi:hypothetical protein